MSKPKPKPNDVVHVSWLDACNHHSWQPRRVGERKGLISVATVGLLLKRTKRLIVVAMSWDDSGSVADVQTIPTSQVRDVFVLSRPKRKRE